MSTAAEGRPEPQTWADLQPGDVIEDAYGNPAVVLKLRTLPGTTPVSWRDYTVMQTAGSDRGRQSSPGTIFRLHTGETAEWAREIAREQWRKGNRW